MEPILTSNPPFQRPKLVFTGFLHLFSGLSDYTFAVALTLQCGCIDSKLHLH